jgi:hypothetical protein
MATFTYTLTAATLTITASMGLKSIAVRLISGSGTVTGTAKLPDGSGNLLDSTPLTLDDVPLSIPGDPVVDGVVITAAGGSSIEIIGLPAKA